MKYAQLGNCKSRRCYIHKVAISQKQNKRPNDKMLEQFQFWVDTINLNMNMNMK